MRLTVLNRRGGNWIGPRASSSRSSVRVAMSFSRPAPLRQSHSPQSTSDRCRRLHGFDVGVQTIESLPHVDRAQRHEDTRCWRNTQHARPRRSMARSSTDNPSRQRSVTPSGATTSIAHPGDEAAARGGETLTSRNTTAGTRLGAFCASDSHRCRLGRGIRRRLANSL